MADTVIANGNVFKIESTLADVNDLWISADDFTRINGFVLKPEGACYESICIPIRQDDDNDLHVTRDDKHWFNATEFAKRIQQPVVADRESGVWSFGMVPAARESFLESAEAPDFELKDRQGNIVRLSDLRGKKVIVTTWASWCGCRLDVPEWQAFYEEHGEDFELISVAEDTGGEAAAGQIFDDADVSYTAIIDEDHTISSLFNFVNVPSAVWIDEEGRVARINEGTYVSKHKIGTFEFGTDKYIPAVEDWLKNGEKSEYVWSPEEVSEQIIPRTDGEDLADATFKLAVYFHSQGDEERANKYWEQAQKLSPDNWNYHRQDWSFTPDEAIPNWARKVQSLGDKPYYRPLGINH